MMLGTLKIREVFARLRQTHRKALIPFVMAGDPSLPATAQLIQALAGVGADCVEVGIPFSDPLADGPTIQRASSRALGTGVTPAAVLKMIARIKRRVAVPLPLIPHLSPVGAHRS